MEVGKALHEMIIAELGHFRPLWARPVTDAATILCDYLLCDAASTRLFLMSGQTHDMACHSSRLILPQRKKHSYIVIVRIHMHSDIQT